MYRHFLCFRFKEKYHPLIRAEIRCKQLHLASELVDDFFEQLYKHNFDDLLRRDCRKDLETEEEPKEDQNSDKSDEETSKVKYIYDYNFIHNFVSHKICFSTHN